MTDRQPVVVNMPIAFLTLFILTILTWLPLRKRSEKVKNVPFIVITLLLIIGEGLKQIISMREGYNRWHIPLHFCSTYFLWFALAEFSPKKMRGTMRNIAFIATLYLAVGLIVSPRGIFGGAMDDVFESYFSAHTIIFHMLVIWYLMLCIAFKRFHPKKVDALVWIVCFAIYFAVAAICAYTFEENYFNILNSEPLPIFETVRLQVGQLAYNAGLLFVLLFFGSAIIWTAARICDKNREKYNVKNKYPMLDSKNVNVTSRR